MPAGPRKVCKTIGDSKDAPFKEELTAPRERPAGPGVERVPTGGLPWATETDEVLAGPAEAEAPGRRRVAPHLLGGPAEAA